MRVHLTALSKGNAKVSNNTERNDLIYKSVWNLCFSSHTFILLDRGMSTRRSGRERKKRFDADFIDDSSFDDEDNKPLVKKKKKVESDFSDFDGSSDEQDEEVDSEDLCDDSTDSDKSWGKRKSKTPASKGKEAKAVRKKKPDSEQAFKGKTAKKEPKLSDDDDDDDNDDDDQSDDDILPKSRRTRGKKLPYLLDDDFDSSDDGIKPGVKRPGKIDQIKVK